MVSKISWFVAGLSLVALLSSAQTVGQSSGPTSSSNQYVNFAFLPAPAQLYLFALGDRIQKAGKERTTLSGTFTDASSATTNAQLLMTLHFAQTYKSRRSDPQDLKQTPCVDSISTCPRSGRYALSGTYNGQLVSVGTKMENILQS